VTGGVSCQAAPYEWRAMHAEGWNSSEGTSRTLLAPAARLQPARVPAAKVGLECPAEITLPGGEAELI
jgi:hypothetical protein